MSNENKLIPELRFPEFENDGEWEINEFGELINILADYTANGSFASLKENVTYYSSEEYAVLVRTTDLDKKTFTPARFTDKRGYEFLSKTSLFGNEIVMANVGSIGKVFRVPYYNKKMTLAPNTYVLKFNDFVEEDFIYQLMLRSEFEKQLLSMVGSSTLMAINKSNLRSIKVAVPKKIEQQKIASCLSSLDEIIATHSQKLDLLKDHKKGLMQNLFPQEGEKVPKYRFKEFENDGEWVEEPLSSKISVIDGDRGLNYPKAEEYSSDGYCLFLSAKNVTKSGFLFNEFQFITKEKDELLRKGKLARFDIVLTTRGSLGQFAFFDENIQFENIRINSGMVILRAKDNGINPNYLYSYFNSNSIQSAIKSQGFGNAVQQLTVAVINNFTLRYPYDPKEQQKIASCLSSLDSLITAQVEKIEQLKLHKKGLMQGLFPKINE